MGDGINGVGGPGRVSGNQSNSQPPTNAFHVGPEVQSAPRDFGNGQPGNSGIFAHAFQLAKFNATSQNTPNQQEMMALTDQGARHTANFFGAMMAQNEVNNDFQHTHNNQRARNNTTEQQAMDDNADTMKKLASAQRGASGAAAAG
ncbi:MAG: hypothetical protein MUE98_00915 [Rhodobacteraceae bacterium]|nr:hypothetical protein [Paracoccaceae bacterium]